MGIHPILCESKEELQKLECKEENRDVSHLTNHEIDEIKNRMQHAEHLKQEGGSPFEVFKFRCNIITREDHIKYRSLNIITSIDMPTKPPPGLSESSGSSERYSQQMTPIE